MAKNNLPKLKQIQGGTQIRSDVDSLLPILESYEASKVTTTVSDGKNGTLTLDKVLQNLLSTSSSSGSDISSLQEAIQAINDIPISDYVRLYGTITVTKSGDNYTNSAVLDDADKLSELVPSMQSTTAYIYTEDNKPLFDASGEQISYNFTTNTLSENGVPSKADYSGDEITYVPVEGTTRFKVFPIGSFKLATLPENYLLDNEELNLVYYAKSIDDLAFSISKNTDLIETVKNLVGEKSVANQLASLKEDLQAQITANKTSLDGLTADSATEGSVDYKVTAAKTAIKETTDDLDSRLTTAESAITTLNGENTVTGSVAKAVKDLNDTLAPKITANENAITKLNADSTTVGSVDYKVNAAVTTINNTTAGLRTDVDNNTSAITTLTGDSSTAGSVAKQVKDASDTLEAKITTNTNAITKLNGANTVEGSVAKQVKDAKDAVTTVTDALDERVTANESAISTNTAALAVLNGDKDTAGSVTKAVTDLDTKLSKADEDLLAMINEITGVDTDSAVSMSSLDERLKTAEDSITTLTGADTTEGSVDYKVAAAKTAIKETTDALDGRVTANESAITKLNANSTTSGSVDYKIAAAKTAIKETTDALDGRLTTAESAISTNASDISTINSTLNETVTTVNGHTTTLNTLTGSVAKQIKDAVDVINTRVHTVETLTVDSEKQTVFTFAKSIPDGYAVTSDTIKININSLVYYEATAFTVSRNDKTITWTSTEANGGFDLVEDDFVQVEYIIKKSS
jgi:hypothetical protein